jgi:MFS transporter, OFA family, oxalate/formate antiporter
VGAEPESESEGWTLREALATPTFWLLGATFCLGIMAGAAIHAHLVACLQDAGSTLEAASTIAGVTLGMMMGGRFMVGWASEHTRDLHVSLSLCLVLQALGAGLLACSRGNGWMLAAFVPLFGLGNGGLIVLWPLTVGHDFGTRSFGAIAGMVGTVALSLGGAVGPVVVGAMYDNLGSYTLAFVSCAVVSLLGAIVAFVTMAPHKLSHAVAPKP